MGGIYLAILVFSLGFLFFISSYANANEFSGPSLIGNYLGDHGIPIGDNGLNINLGKIYSDFLKVNGDAIALHSCGTTNGSYDKCIEEKMSEDEQEGYAQFTGYMNEAIDAGNDYGIDFGSIPFVADFLSLK